MKLDRIGVRFFLGALLLAGALLTVLLVVCLVSAKSAKADLEEARRRLDEAAKTPAYEGYRRAAERQALVEDPEAPPPSSPTLALDRAPDLSLEDASQLILGKMRDTSYAESLDEREALHDEVLDHPVGKWSPEDLARVDAYMSEWTPLVDAFRTLMRRGGPLPQPEWGAASRSTAWYTLTVATAGRALAREALRCAGHGDDRAARDILCDLMDLGDRAGAQPLQWANLKRYEAYSEALHALDLMTYERQLAPGLVSDILNRLASAHGRQEFAQSLSADLSLNLDAFRSIDEQWPSRLFLSTRQWLAECSYRTPFGKALRYQDETALLAWGMWYIENASSPYYELEASIDSEALPATGIISDTYVYLMGSQSRSQASHETNIDLARLGLLIEQYGRSHGRFPETLAEIEPLRGDPLPKDPFTGEPYRYIVREDDFLLYGLGPNMVDDEGFHDICIGDLVWRGRVDAELAESRWSGTIKLFERELGVDLSEAEE